MRYSQEEKRKIILDNYRKPSKQVDLKELERISGNLQIPFSTSHSLGQGCGDVIHLLIIKKDSYIENYFFSGQQSCLITVAAANILGSCLERKNFNFVNDLINNCQSMINGKEYNLS